jgi:hypothetical protein
MDDDGVFLGGECGWVGEEGVGTYDCFRVLQRGAEEDGINT